MRIDHINIAAPAALLAEVRDFYCAVFGLDDGPRPDFGIPGHWLYSDGKPIVHLLESAQHTGSATPYHLDHVAFELQGLAAFTARLDALGVSYFALPNQVTRMTQVFLKDPCGIGLEANFPGELTR